MTISINDLWGSNIAVTSYSCEGNKFNGTLQFRLYDHFGLDQPDVENRKYIKFDGFRAWFVLQHFDSYDGKYEPFINLMAYEINFSGEF